MDRFEQINDCYKSFQTTKTNLDETITTKESKLADLNDERSELLEEKENLNKSLEVVKQIIDTVFLQSIETYKGLINDGLNTIFYDRTYRFDIEMDDYGNNKTAELLYSEKVDDEWTDWRDVDTASGGSVRAVIDLITRVFLIKQTGRRKFLCMDESLSMLSDKYVQPVVDFLNNLAEEMDFDFLMVTHDPRFKEHGQNVYRMDKGTVEQVK